MKRNTCAYFNSVRCKMPPATESVYCGLHKTELESELTTGWSSIKVISNTHGNESDSILLQTAKYILKAWFPGLLRQHKRPAFVEDIVYSEIVKPLSYHTPSLVTWFGNSSCDKPPETVLQAYRDMFEPANDDPDSVDNDDISGFDRSDSDRANVESEGDDSSEYDSQVVVNSGDRNSPRGSSDSVGLENTMRYIILEIMPGKSVLDWTGVLKQDQVTLFLEDVFFQVAYALLCFQDFGLMHNDLHIGNVFVEDLDPKTETCTFQTTLNRYYSRKIRYKVRIFDFDHASVTTTPYNSRPVINPLLDFTEEQTLSLCYIQGECNNFRHNFDLYNFTASLYHFQTYNVSQPKQPIDLDSITRIIQSFCTTRLFGEHQYPEVTARVIAERSKHTGSGSEKHGVTPLVLSRTAKACAPQPAAPCTPLHLGSPHLLNTLVVEFQNVAPPTTALGYYTLPSCLN